MRWRRRLALLAGAITLAATTGAWLASTGTVAVPIAPVAGMPASGLVADVTPMTAVIQHRDGGSQYDKGLTVARITVASAYAARLRVIIAWTNSSNARHLLGNANAYIKVGIYHPVSMSTSGNSSGPCSAHDRDAPYASIYDSQLGTGTSICVALDATVTGTAAQLDEGKLLLSRKQISGILEPGIPAPASALSTTCTTTTSPWCQAYPAPGQAVYYVVAELFSPGDGGLPDHIGGLNFYVKANARP